VVFGEVKAGSGETAEFASLVSAATEFSAEAGLSLILCVVVCVVEIILIC